MGANITPYYDSLLIKITGRAGTRRDVIMKLQRALKEFRVRCVFVFFLLDPLVGPLILLTSIYTYTAACTPTSPSS